MASGALPGKSMTISFAIPFECGPSLDVMVLYGEKDQMTDDAVRFNHVARSAKHEPKQYNATHGPHYTYISDYFHHVPIIGLDPSTTYMYQCVVVHKHSLAVDQFISDEGSNVVPVLDARRQRRRLLHSTTEGSTTTPSSTVARSDVAQFTTPALPGDTTVPVQLALIGDLGQSIHSAQTIHHMTRLLSNITAILHAGDLSYADCVHLRWDAWFDLIEPLSSRVPWHVCPGNHEIEIEHPSGRIFTSYRSRFEMPSNHNFAEIIEPLDEHDPKRHDKKQCCPSVAMTAYDYGNSFHSITFGSVHVLFLNSYTSSKPQSNQYRWVSSELRHLDRSKIPWVVVVMHCPFYNTFASHQNEKQEEQMKKYFEPLFVRYNVNVVVAGHVHAYRYVEVWF